MKSTINRLLSLILLGSYFTLFGMDNGLPKPNFSGLDAYRDEYQPEPLGSDTEDDIPALQGQFNMLKNQLQNNPANGTALKNQLEQLRITATQQLEQELAYDIAAYLNQQ